MSAPEAPAGAREPSETPLRPRARRRRRWWIWSAAGALAAFAAVTLLWFQPQKLLYDQRVDEALPSAAPAASAARSGAATPAAAPAELATGAFVSREHATHGTARLLRLADGRVLVRFEGFATSNGPVLVVRLSTNPAHGPDGAFAHHYVNLGPLKGNVGDQNYAVPADATAYRSVVVWCNRFSVAFGAADLVPST